VRQVIKVLELSFAMKTNKRLTLLVKYGNFEKKVYPHVLIFFADRDEEAAKPDGERLDSWSAQTMRMKYPGYSFLVLNSSFHDLF
jgi:hypothetical protein